MISAIAELPPSSPPPDSEGRPRAIAEHALALLRATGRPALQWIECEYVDGGLILRGVVPSFYLKQVAQETLRGALGGNRILNALAVEYATPLSGWDDL